MTGAPCFNFAMIASGLTTALLGLLLALGAPYVKRWERWYFRATFTLLLAYNLAALAAQVSMGLQESGFAWLARAGAFCELFFSMTIVPLLTAYLLRCAGEDWRASPLLRGAVALWAAYLAVLVAAQFCDAVYYFPAGSQGIEPGPLFPALVAAPVALMALNLVALVRRRNALTHRQRIAFAVYSAVPLACVFLQSAFFDLRIIVAGASISALAMFGFVLIDQMDAHVQQREEAARRQAQVMALQMRPHFIYNIMTSIYYLCAQDPARAQQVTLDFTDYLRANFAAVVEEDDVPFSKELEHTRAYLAVEQARLEGELVVELDCPHKTFHLPPLTLQPLAENAVKHGADPELPPLRVRIETREEDGCSVVAVEDTGPGFDVAILDAHPASALVNIRERLAARGATLEFAPRAGGGTVATIRVPRRA